MGQAKQRGSFDVRKAESIERQRIEREMKALAEQKRKDEYDKWREENPIQHKKVQEKRRANRLMLTMGIGLAASYLPSHAHVMKGED
jgi:hypothetical protein